MAIFLVPQSAGYLPLSGGTLTGDINLDGSQVRFLGSNPANYTGFRGPAGVSSQVVWTLPASDGTSGQALTTNGAGQLGWSASGITAIDGGSFN